MFSLTKVNMTSTIVAQTEGCRGAGQARQLDGVAAVVVWGGQSLPNYAGAERCRRSDAESGHDAGRRAPRDPAAAVRALGSALARGAAARGQRRRAPRLPH